MKKMIKRIIIIFLIALTLLTVNCFAKDEFDIKDIVNKEEGSLFDKTIAKTIGGIAQAVYNLITDEKSDIGFKSYEDMIFKGGSGTAPFSWIRWKVIMAWYKVFAAISGSLILIAVIIIAFKMIAGSFSIMRRNEAKDRLINLMFGGVAIAITPTFIKFLLFLNNSLVNILVSLVTSDKRDLMDNKFLSSITTGNPIATALIISMFIYIFVKLNIKFIVREFTIIVFTIFTPVVVSLWMINRNVTAAAIWWRTNNDKYLYAVYILLFIFAIFNFCIINCRMGCNINMGNDAVTSSRCFNELFAEFNLTSGRA